MNQQVAGGLPRQTLFRHAVAAATADYFEDKKKIRKKKHLLCNIWGLLLWRKKMMIDLLVVRFEKAFSFFGSVAVVVKRGREADQGPGTFTQRAGGIKQTR